MTGHATVTNGGKPETSGETKRIERIGMALVLAGFIVQAVVNTVSKIDDHARAGTGVQPGDVWIWEISSIIVWASIVPIIWIAVRRLRPSRYGWPRIFAAHLALSFAVSVLHVGLMVLLRKLAYAAFGATYEFADDVAAKFFYEYRKDFSTYAAVAALMALIQWTAARPRTLPGDEPAAIVVRDGARTHRLRPDEIDFVEAAGNYVALHGARGEILNRATLASMEAELAKRGFVRIHRSRLVRASAIVSVETNSSGDFELELASGKRIVGSRRYRAALDAALGA